MKKLFIYFLRFVAGLLVILFLVSFASWIYIKNHKASILEYIKTASAKRLNGEILIGDINASLFETFPKISITLRDISIRDSAWKDHHHDLLKANKAFASLSIFSLLRGRLVVDKLILDGATLYLYTDSSGYSNTSIFKKNKDTQKSKQTDVAYPSLELKNSKFIIEKKDKNKLFIFEVKKLLGRVVQQEDNGTLHLNISLDAFSRGLGFNKANGAFIEEKAIEGIFPIEFNPKSKILQFEDIVLKVAQQPIHLTGKFFLAEVPTPFLLSIKTEDLPYKKAASFVAQNIRRKLDQYNIEDPISKLSVSIDNSDPEYKTPLIHLSLQVKNTSITTPLASFDHASFTGHYNNEVVRGKGHGDDNSELRFSDFSGIWEDMKMNCDSVVISNLIHPVIRCNLRSDVEVSAINNLVDDKVLAFNYGHAKLNLVYIGSLEDSSGLDRDLTGTIGLDSASLTYLPRNFSLTGCRGRIRFNHKDMYFDELHANSGSSDLSMNGGVKNLFSLIDKNDDKFLLNWNILSSKINLADFNAFLKKKTVHTVKKKKKVLFAETISKITSLLESCSMQITLKSKQLLYKKFYATNLNAAIDLTNDAIILKNILLDHADGSLSVSGSILNLPNSNPVTIRAQMNKMDVTKLLTAFDNFGQQAITDKNLKGILTAEIKAKGILTEKATIISDSTRGTIEFSLVNGQLIHFEPVEKISKTVFKNRDFSDIQFANLKDKFDISGDNITINRMEIRSTVMTMFVEGTYHLKKGADLSIQVPLSNLKASTSDSVLVNKGVDSKTGVSARLRAKNGADGKLKISWDPFNKAVRKMKKK